LVAGAALDGVIQQQSAASHRHSPAVAAILAALDMTTERG